MADRCELRIASSLGEYNVTIQTGCLERALHDDPPAVVVADDFFADRFGGVAPVVAIEAREERKTLRGAEDLILALNQAGLRRGQTVLAVGGGVVQDLATLAASLYMRGVPWVYAPTTLMAMADSCVGGKSSINVGPLKNLVGNIHPPRAVLVDPSFTATLAPDEIAAGLCEAVKICFCRGPETLTTYLELFDALGQPNGMDALVAHTLEAKRWFVEIDEFDQKERRLLNFGHTFGHALEVSTGYLVNHGVAIGIGMVAAAAFGKVIDEPGPTAELVSHVLALLRPLPDLPAALAAFDADVFESAFTRDKKHTTHHLRLILPRSCGGVEEAAVQPTVPELQRVVEAMVHAIERVRS